MATHSSVLARRISGMGEPGGLLYMGLQSRTQMKQLSSSSSKLTKTKDLKLITYLFTLRNWKKKSKLNPKLKRGRR